MRTYNIKDTYLDKDDTWLVILAAAALSIIYTTNGLKVYTWGKLSFGRDIILPIKNTVDWELIHHQK